MGAVRFNAVLRIASPELSGYFRVLVSTAQIDTVLLYKICDLKSDDKNTFYVSAPTKRSTKKMRAQEPSKFCWVATERLESLERDLLLQKVKVLRDPGTPDPAAPLTKKQTKFYEIRKSAMGPFMDGVALQRVLLSPRGFAKLVKETQCKFKKARSAIHWWFHLLCRYGFTEDSLRPQTHKCGGPGRRRPWGRSARRKKPGRWTNNERDKYSRENGRPQSRGWTQQQEERYIKNYKRLRDPKKAFGDIHREAVKLSFSTKVVERNGELTPVFPSKGTYPNVRAGRRIIELDIGEIQLLKDRTTAGFFDRNQRGLIGRSFRGVPGPGHRYGMDATLGDEYLRSSVNRAWLIGRPIVYLIVDAWSTAVVGVHVALEGPSWATAQSALYSACISPEEFSSIWGVNYCPFLDPYPTIPWELVVDRGEMFCTRAAAAAELLGWKHTVNAAYRPDLKGWVEVLHRIVQKRIFAFSPGAINARRKEYELRTDPRAAILTLREYLALLALEIERYNCTADRRGRVTDEMLSVGVVPTPAGLWRFGHQIGLGYQKSIEEHLLISQLLPSIPIHVVGRGGAFVGDLHYKGEPSLDWATRARNFGSFTLNAHFHPGTVSRIWVPDSARGLTHCLNLSTEATAKPETTYDEHQDAVAVKSHSNASFEHSQEKKKSEIDDRRNKIISAAAKQTAEALAKPGKDKPTVAEARAEEPSIKNAQRARNGKKNAAPATTANDYRDPGDSTYERMMAKILSVPPATVGAS